MLITLFSDASVCHDHRVGGWAAWIKSDRGGLRLGGRFGVRVHDVTLAEAMAVVNGLHSGARDGAILPGDEVLVQTDNDAVMSVLLGQARRRASKAAKTRRRLSWKELKRDVRERNAEIDAIAAGYSRIVDGLDLAVRWRHVKGHRAVEDRRAAVNTHCDRVARGHMVAARSTQPPTMSEREAAARAARDGTTVALAA